MLNNTVVVSPNIEFSFDAPNAESVSVLGNWDSWTYAVPLSYCYETGMWHGHSLVKPGKYQYQFIVDDERAHNPAEAAQFVRGRGMANVVSSSPP
jgi:1,4-alpha-glucan branching enzyme